MSRPTVVLYLHPRQKFSREEVYRLFGPYAVFLDGCCSDGPFIDRARPVASLDHHNKVIRSITRATSHQAYDQVNGDLFDLFRKDGIPYVELHANDPDPDVFTAVYCFTHYPYISTPQVRRIVEVTGQIDIYGGWHPSLPLDSSILRELAWINEPYAEARIGGELARMTEGGMRRVIESCCARIDKNIHGHGGEIPLDEKNTSYEVLESTNFGLEVVHEHGYYARMKMRARGMRHFISVRDGVDGKHLYSDGFLTLYPAREVPPLELQFEDLNIAERLAGGTETWGGSDLIGGGPWGGSVLPPSEVVRVIGGTYHRYRTSLNS